MDRAQDCYHIKFLLLEMEWAVQEFDTNILNQCLPSDFDIAAGIHEELINDFAVSHHKQNYRPGQSSVYSGQDEAPDLGISKWSYDVFQAANVDLSPIAERLSKRMGQIWVANAPDFAHLSESELEVLATELNRNPNGKITLPSVRLGLEFDPNVTSPPPPPISVEFGIVATGIFFVDDEKHFAFLPQRIEVLDPDLLDHEVKSAVAELGVLEGIDVSISKDQICYPIGKLIRHFVRAFMKTRVNQYLIDFPLPSAIDLFEGFAIGDLEVVACDNYLIVYGDGMPASSAIRDEQGRGLDTNSQLDISRGEDRSVEVGSIDRTSDTDDGQLQINSQRTDGGFCFLIISRRIFEVLADRSLNIDESDSDSDSSGAFRWSWSWWMKLRNKGVSFRGQNQIRFAVDFDGGGSARLKLKTKIGSISVSTGLRADLVPSPTKIDLSPRIWTRAIGLRIDTKPSKVIIRPTKWYDLFGWVIGAILTAVGTVIWNILDFAFNFTAIKLATLPEKFPGTELSYSVDAYSSKFWGQDHLLMQLKIDFED